MGYGCKSVIEMTKGNCNIFRRIGSIHKTVLCFFCLDFTTHHSGAEGATKYFSILCFFGFSEKF